MQKRERLWDNGTEYQLQNNILQVDSTDVRVKNVNKRRKAVILKV